MKRKDIMDTAIPLSPSQAHPTMTEVIVDLYRVHLHLEREDLH